MGELSETYYAIGCLILLTPACKLGGRCPQENRALAPNRISYKVCYGSGQNIEQMGSASYSCDLMIFSEYSRSLRLLCDMHLWWGVSLKNIRISTAPERRNK